MRNNILYYIGIDIQVKKGCPFFIVDKNADTIDSVNLGTLLTKLNNSMKVALIHLNLGSNPP